MLHIVSTDSPPPPRGTRKRRRAALLTALEYLGVELAEGPVQAEALLEGSPVSVRTLRRAKIELEIESIRHGGVWWWCPAGWSEETEDDEG